jgi:hypothetical protein
MNMKLLAAVALAIASGCSSGPDTKSSALTGAQCIYFESNGTVEICHATGSAKNPFVLLKLSENGCINGHLAHPHDFIDTLGGNCNNAACLPIGAPCDATLGCCSGTCNSGSNTCTCSEPSGGCATDSDCCAGICYRDACCTPLAACPVGLNCGTIDDGCGGTLNCGTCNAPETCGGGGTANQCGVACASAGAACAASGACCSGLVCNATTSSCCAPLTACPTGENCGTASDGCGGTLSCGTCTGNDTCGGGGTPNVCGQSGCTAASGDPCDPSATTGDMCCTSGTCDTTNNACP